MHDNQSKTSILICKGGSSLLTSQKWWNWIEHIISLGIHQSELWALGSWSQTALHTLHFKTGFKINKIMICQVCTKTSTLKCITGRNEDSHHYLIVWKYLWMLIAREFPYILHNRVTWGIRFVVDQRKGGLSHCSPFYTLKLSKDFTENMCAR